MTKERPLTLKLALLGTIYGLLWGVVALVILSFGKRGLPHAYETITYLVGSIPTGIMVTCLLAPLLRRTKSWATWLCGPATLLLGTLIFAANMLLIHAGLDYGRNLTSHGVFGSLQEVRTHDSTIMFFWYPVVGFASIIPIFLAVANCRDLRQRIASHR